MNGSRRIAWCLRLVVMTFCTSLLGGCLDAEKTVLIAYDAATDTFTYLVVYQQLREYYQSTRPLLGSQSPATNRAPATRPDDGGEADLRAIASNRANVLISPAPKWLLIDFGWLKQPNRQGALCNILNLTNEGGSTPPIDITGVRIIPGSFFMRGKDNLCYYQAAVVPGSVVDRGIEIFNDSKSDQTIGIQEAIDATNSAKGASVSWADAGKVMADWVMHYDGGSGDAMHPADSQSPLSIESLRMLLEQGRRRDFKVRRHGSSVTMDLKLTEHDIDGALGADAIVRKAADDRLTQLADPKVQQTIQNGIDGIALLRGELAIVDAIGLTKLDGRTLRINLDLIRFCTAGTLRPADPLLSLGPESDRATNTAEVATKSVPIDAHMTVEHLQAFFLAVKLSGSRH
jgi:hypothetical protein